MAAAATNVGVVGMTLLQTPKDFADSCRQRPRPIAPVRAIQNNAGTSAPPVPSIVMADIRWMDIKEAHR